MLTRKLPRLCPLKQFNRYRGGSGGLDAGLGLIWLCIVSAGVNIDSFTMEPWGPVPPTPSPLDNVTPAPTEAPTQAEQSGAYGGVPSSIPGIVEAEEFDYGGEGVGYSDKTSDNTGGVSCYPFFCMTNGRQVKIVRYRWFLTGRLPEQATGT